MKKIFVILGCSLFMPAIVNATNCEDVKAMIAEKIKANGVEVFTLEAVEKGTATSGKVVGVCGGGTKDVVYYRGVQSSEQKQQTTTETSEVTE